MSPFLLQKAQAVMEKTREKTQEKTLNNFLMHLFYRYTHITNLFYRYTYIYVYNITDKTLETSSEIDKR